MISVWQTHALIGGEADLTRYIALHFISPSAVCFQEDEINTPLKDALTEGEVDLIRYLAVNFIIFSIE